MINLFDTRKKAIFLGIVCLVIGFCIGFILGFEQGISQTIKQALKVIPIFTNITIKEDILRDAIFSYQNQLAGKYSKCI